MFVADCGMVCTQGLGRVARTWEREIPCAHLKWQDLQHRQDCVCCGRVDKRHLAASGRTVGRGGTFLCHDEVA